MQERMAELVLKKAMNRIKEEFPPLIPAVNLLSPKAVQEPLGKPKEWLVDSWVSLATDGEYLFYDPDALLMDFRESGLMGVQYSVLHVMMHCVLGHLEMDGLYRDRQLLWTVMDREVTHLLSELGMEYEHHDLNGRNISFYNKGMNDVLGTCYDIGCYFKVKNNRSVRRRILREGRNLQIDSHRLWSEQKTEKKNVDMRPVNQSDKAGKDSRNGKDDKGSSSTAADKGKNAEAWGKVRDMLAGGKEGPIQGILLKELQYGRRHEYGSGSMGATELVKARGENQNSYHHILTELLQNKESAKVSPDAIDNMLYQYGLELYGNVPLIEPPDCEERIELNTICVAIDTSGSCSADIAERFLRETYNVLRDIRGISQGGEVYLFQCDDELQSEEYFSSLAELPGEGQERMELHGFGGTSFIPVFQRVEELHRKECKQIDCLIYFTDAEGDYPTEKPDYPVLFILPTSAEEIQHNWFLREQVPAWIQKVGLDE